MAIRWAGTIRLDNSHEIHWVPTMTAADRLNEALTVGGKVRGFRKQNFRHDGTLESISRHHIEVRAGDVVEACAKATRRDDVVCTLANGCAGDPERKVVLHADDVFHVLDMIQTVEA